MKEDVPLVVEMKEDVPLVVRTSRAFPHSWLITGFVNRITRWWVPLVEQELLALLEHPSSPPGFSGVRLTQSLVFNVVFCWSLFGLFLLTIVFSVFRFTASDYPLVPLNFSFQYPIEKYSKQRQQHGYH
jgi:hypothetical protein